MENPKVKTKVVHSQTKSAWNVIGANAGSKFKIARVPYVSTHNDEINTLNRNEAYNHAIYISYCFNQSDLILSIITP